MKPTVPSRTGIVNRNSSDTSHDEPQCVGDAAGASLTPPPGLHALPPEALPAAPTVPTPATTDADADADTPMLSVYLVSDTDRLTRPQLVVCLSSNDIVQDEPAMLFGDATEREFLGEFAVPTGLVALRATAEQQAWALFGGHVGPRGRPTSARYIGHDDGAILLGETAFAAHTWPRLASPEDAVGVATPEAVARSLKRHVVDVRAAFAALRLLPARS